MNSCRDSYHLQISQIEIQSSRCSQQLSELEAALNLLQNSVNSAMSVNEVVKEQNATYSNQLENMKEESNRLLQKVYKNPLYQEIKFREEREQVEIVKLKVQLNHGTERIEELANQLLSVNTDLSKTQKSLQECHQLIKSQSVANKKLEEEVIKQEGEKLEIERKREGEFDTFTAQIITVELERDRIQEEYNQMSIKLAVLSEEHNKAKEDILAQNTGQYECIDMEPEVRLSPVILCPDSQEDIDPPQDSNHTRSEISIQKCSQDSNENDEIIENQVASYTLNTHKSPNSPSPEPPNKRTKLESDTYATPHGSPSISSTDD
ncbi:hypothetical protein LOD99_7028 [Oopsacas minuta]|uniref:Uncharacterized protein n=1 Tax=Oopsacas minuta TaxID=111878 RepID=A0AAV7JKI2_9METZ|nr:hypothetical protein LOD99_7028 [Oopsacas minuta]